MIGDNVNLSSRLEGATKELKLAMERGGQPVDGKTVPGVLAGGEFRAAGNRVEGRWFVDRDFIEALIGGKT